MRVLILSASTGGGHKKASAALKKAIVEKDSDAVVEIIDALECVSHLFNKTVSDGYIFMAKNTPKLYGSMYKSSNKDTSLNTMVSKITDKVSKKLLPAIQGFKPDVIVSAHPFATEMASSLKESYGVTAPLISIVTDFAPHKTYVTQATDCYVVSSDEMIDGLNKMGVPKEKIRSLGIPIDVSFYVKHNREEIMLEKELNPMLPTILIMAGSFGVTDILDIYKNIVGIKEDFQIVVITGKNIKLYESFEKLLGVALEEQDKETLEQTANQMLNDAIDETKSEDERNKLKTAAKHIKHQIKEKTVKLKSELKEATFIQKFSDKECSDYKPTKLLYFVNDVYKYMSIADLIITKPGGLTVSEALASTLPMAIFKAYPGQEAENADFLIKNNMAIWLPEKEGCAATIEGLLKNPDRLEEMKEACRTYCKVRSADNIYKLILELSHQ